MVAGEGIMVMDTEEAGEDTDMATAGVGSTVMDMATLLVPGTDLPITGITLATAAALA